MILGNTFVILVYKYFTYKLRRYVHQIIFQMPIKYVLKYLYTKITKVLPRIMPNHAYRYLQCLFGTIRQFGTLE